jgi:hypothetical protein
MATDDTIAGVLVVSTSSEDQSLVTSIHHCHQLYPPYDSIVAPLRSAHLRAAVSRVSRLKYCAACSVACSLSQSSIPHVTPLTAPVYRYSIILANPSSVKSLPVVIRQSASCDLVLRCMLLLR